MKWISKLFVSLAGITLLAAIALPVHAGWIELNNDGERVVMSKGVFKSATQGEPTWSIMDFNNGTLTVVDTEMKTYTTGTMKEFCDSMSAMMKKMRAGMEAAVVGMSPEQRQMMAQMTGQGAKRPDPKVSITKVGSGGVIAGFKTTKYTVSVDGKPSKEVWLTSDSALMKDLKPYLDKILKMSDMSSCGIEQASMMGGQFDVENSDEYNKLMQQGYPLREKDILIPGDPTRVMSSLREVTSLVKQSIPASEFAPPKGYKKMSFSEMMQIQMGGQGR